MGTYEFSLFDQKPFPKKLFLLLLITELAFLLLSALRPQIALLMLVPLVGAVFFLFINRLPHYGLLLLVYGILLGPVSTIPLGDKVPEVFFVDFLLIFLCFTLFLRSLARRNTIAVRIVPIEIRFLIFIAFSFLTILPAVDFFRGLASLRNYIVGWIVLVLTLHYVKNSKQIRKLFWGLMIWGVVLSLLQLYQVLQQGNILLTVLTKNIHLSWGSSNYIAAFYAILIPLILSMIFTRGISSIAKGVLLCATLLMIISMFLTGSRGAVVALIVGLIVLLWRFHSWRMTTAFLFFCGFAGVIIFSIPSSQIIWQGLVGYQTSPSVLSRIELWQESLRIFRLHPILGVGLGNINYHVQLAGTLFMRSHNLVLELLSETGIIGLLLFLSLLIGILRAQIKNCQQIQGDFQKSLAWGILAGTITALTHSMVEPNISSYMFSILFWLIVGISLKQNELNTSVKQRKNAVGRS